MYLWVVVIGSCGPQPIRGGRVYFRYPGIWPGSKTAMISVTLPLNKRLSMWDRFEYLHYLAMNPIILVLIVVSLVVVSAGLGWAISSYGS